MYNIHNKSTSRYHFDSCSLPSQLTICMRLQFEIILSRSVQQRKRQQWKRGDAFECRKMNKIRFISAIDCVVQFLLGSVLFCSVINIACVAVVWRHSWVRNEHANLCSIIAYLSLWSQTFPFRSHSLACLLFSCSLLTDFHIQNNWNGRMSMIQPQLMPSLCIIITQILRIWLRLRVTH